MPKYELTEEQVKTLLQVIDDTAFQGKFAQRVIMLKSALLNPVESKQPDSSLPSNGAEHSKG